MMKTRKRKRNQNKVAALIDAITPANKGLNLTEEYQEALHSAKMMRYWCQRSTIREPANGNRSGGDGIGDDVKLERQY